ncbi:hypothetical protein [Halopiger xanaduensis]|uniref:Uncharacterized protein n=1 Tax=Halopiger xanaduensis (strain DSM 18323 / JCM 14033 / SH-6) TaxID=797210 RepID=F8DAN7_HALXS|nr:hypothetical protein [Halopiger xanaduensis]AEH35848.1 hypothetical protein Halxa_1215 [Halopiger xanaduensis SH-6]
MPALPRRRLLAGAGTALAGVLAGCSSDASDDSDGTDSEDGNETDDGTGDGSTADSDAAPDSNDGGDTDDGGDSATDGTALGEISIENVHDRSHTVDVIVEFDGEIEHWTTHELEAGDGTTLERDWPTEAGSFRLMARLDGAELTQVEPAEWNEPACLNLVAMIDRNGALKLLSDTDGGPCGDGETAFSGNSTESGAGGAE